MWLSAILVEVHATEKDVTACAKHPMVRGLITVPFSGMVGGIPLAAQDFRKADQAVRNISAITGQPIDISSCQQHDPARNANCTLVSTHDMGLCEQHS